MKNIKMRTPHKEKGEYLLKVKLEPTLNWEDAPDTITPEDLKNILGIGIEGARKIFNKSDFPKINEIGNIGKADKEAARLYIQGIKINKNNSKETLLSMIYFELKKLNLK